MKLLKGQPVLFLILYIISFLVSILLLMNLVKGYTTIYLNNLNISFLDLIMPHITLLGEWLGVILAIVFVIYKERKKGIWFLVALLLGLLVVYVFKHQIYRGEGRPYLLLEKGSLHQIGDVLLRKRNSFPSGHTFTAFLCAYGVAISAKKYWIEALAFTMAILVAISRMYLGQHFLQDVVFGSILAILLGLLIRLIFNFYKGDK